jgi:hypothetical protein
LLQLLLKLILLMLQLLLLQEMPLRLGLLLLVGHPTRVDLFTIIKPTTKDMTRAWGLFKFMVIGGSCQGMGIHFFLV